MFATQITFLAGEITISPSLWKPATEASRHSTATALTKLVLQSRFDLGAPAEKIE